MERIIQLVQAVHAEANALAWAALGILLPFGIVAGLLVLAWIRRGGLRARGTHGLIDAETEIPRAGKEADP